MRPSVGKTRLGAALCLESALRGGCAWWVAPTYKVAAVGWRQLRRLAKQVPGAVVQQTDKRCEFPGGGWYQVRSADEPDSLRGEGLDRVILDECAYIAEDAWTGSLRPALSDRKGTALFISTPSGRNWFWRLWAKGQDPQQSEWRSWRFPSASNPFLDPAEVEAARADLPERTHQQEYEAVFLDESGGVFRNVHACVDPRRTSESPPVGGRSYVLGVDLARVQDFSAISVLDDAGRQVYFERFNQISWERQIEAICRVAARYSVQSGGGTRPGRQAVVHLDCTGLGDPIYEALRGRGLRVEPFRFTATSKEQLIDNLAMLLEAGKLRLMDVPTQTNELLAYQYELTPSRHIRMNAPSGLHDDTVIALALAAWGLAGGRDDAIRATGNPFSGYRG